MRTTKQSLTVLERYRPVEVGKEDNFGLLI